MAQFASSFPLLPGKEQATRDFVDQIKKRWKEFDATQRRSGTSKELWSLSTTPQGSFITVYFEARDIGKTLGYIAKSNTKFDSWFKAKIKEITGVDMEAPSTGPLPENILLYGY